MSQGAPNGRPGIPRRRWFSAPQRLASSSLTVSTAASSIRWAPARSISIRANATPSTAFMAPTSPARSAATSPRAASASSTRTSSISTAASPSAPKSSCGDSLLMKASWPGQDPAISSPAADHRVKPGDDNLGLSRRPSIHQRKLASRLAECLLDLFRRLAYARELEARAARAFEPRLDDVGADRLELAPARFDLDEAFRIAPLAALLEQRELALEFENNVVIIARHFRPEGTMRVGGE